MPPSSINTTEETLPAGSLTYSWMKDPTTWGERLKIPEWDDPNYRQTNGWRGNDLVHSPHAPVRISEYYVQYPHSSGGGVGTRLTGRVFFSAAAESHQGLCHGGSMCSVMDDVVGWLGFCTTGEVRPWTGYTVQINTQLLRPIPVDSSLVVTATIDRVERRKVFITARIVDPNGSSPVEHAKCEGVVVLNRGILSPVEPSATQT